MDDGFSSCCLGPPAVSHTRSGVLRASCATSEMLIRECMQLFHDNKSAASQMVQASVSQPLCSHHHTESQRQWHVAFGAHNAITHSVGRWSSKQGWEAEKATKVLHAILAPLTK